MKTRSTFFSVFMILVLLTGMVFQVTPAQAAPPRAPAIDLANAFAEVPAQITGVSFIHEANTGSTAVFSSASTIFPTGSDGTFIGMSSGIAANMPTVGANITTNFGDSYNGVLDVTILKIDLLAPAGTDCLQFDTQFFSREYPEYVGDIYNDAFVAELDVNDWIVSGTTITAPHNFALAPGGKVLSINSGLDYSAALAAGTAFSADGATDKYLVSTPTTAGAHSLYLTIWDMGDNTYDSAIYLDRLRMFNSSGTCTSGVIVIPPTITGIAPNSGPVAGGTSVVITGTDLTGGTVTFGGLAATCTVDSATQITCTSPAHAAGAVDVVVTTLDGSATSTGGFTYVAAPVPTITDIAPNSGPTAGGTSVVITGTNLTGGTVTFGGTAATCTVDSATQITCTSPAGTAGAVDVVVTTPDGTATSADGFIYIPAPTIGSIVPNSGPTVGGTSVVITGTNLSGGTVTFDGTAATCTVDSATQITCTSPAHTAGAVDVIVTTLGGTATSAGSFTYVPAPSISSIVPNSGPTAGGTSVVITGTNLSGGTVTFDGTAATCTVDSATQITCTSPAHTAGAVDVVVTTPGGVATSASGFTYVPAPSITSIVPNSGPTAGGTSVVITGTNLSGGTVTFDGTPATCTVDTDTQLTCTSPAHMAGAVDVVVTTPGGAATSAGGFTYIPAPTISSIVPNSGPTAGGTSVVITDTNLIGGSATFDGLAATCTVDSVTQMTCISPAHAAGPVDVVVTTPNGTDTSVNGFTYIAAPTISSIVPNSGPTAGGTSVVITGTNLATTFHVEFGAAPATCTVDSDTQITCTSPAHAAGPVDVDVATLGGINTSVNGFTYIAAPTISSIVPNSGPTAGGTSVVITGTNLTGGTVTFGGLAATCTVDSATQVTCTSPAHAAGPVDVVVTTPGGSATTSGGFTYIAQAITGIAPNSGPTGGGTTVVITGIGFTGSTAFTFGGSAATCTVDSDTQITCTSPTHTAGLVDVVITTPTGAATLVDGFTYIPAALTLTASGPATVKPGDQYVYTLSYTTNTKPFNAQVKFTLPGHTTFVSNTGGYTCAAAAGIVTCDLGGITTNDSFTATVQVDKLKKINTPLTLAMGSYSISDDGAALATGLATVTANTLTPFADVAAGYFRIDYIQSIWAYGITTGCVKVPLTYCPDRNITRGEMAAYIERGIHTGSYVPPVVALTYSDTGTSTFKYFIEALKSDGITNGCSNIDKTIYCPGDPIKRSQMAVFLLRGKYWPAVHVPTAATGTVFTDVPASSFAASWIEELASLGITSGCTANTFCPNDGVTRSQMAALVQRTFNLPMPTP